MTRRISTIGGNHYKPSLATVTGREAFQGIVVKRKKNVRDL